MWEKLHFAKKTKLFFDDSGFLIFRYGKMFVNNFITHKWNRMCIRIKKNGLFLNDNSKKRRYALSNMSHSPKPLFNLNSKFIYLAFVLKFENKLRTKSKKRERSTISLETLAPYMFGTKNIFFKSCQHSHFIPTKNQ